MKDKKLFLSIPLKSNKDVSSETCSSETFLDLADHQKLTQMLYETEKLSEYGDAGMKLAGAMSSVILSHKLLQLTVSETMGEIDLMPFINETIH